MTTMFSRALSYIFVLLALFTCLSKQDTKDPLKDFCRRFGHQTAVIDRRLYIDGGQVNWNPISQNPLNYTNTWLSYQDLDVTNQGMPQLHANLSKNSSVPDVSGGVLWADEVNKVLYLYGGEFQSSPEDFTLWAYDVILDQWNRSTADTSRIQRVSHGAGVAINDRAEGYYLGGWLSNLTVPGWSGPPVATSNLIKYDMIGNVFSNNFGPDTTGRAEGVMVYLPASDRGLLVYFGGILDPYKNGTTVRSATSTIYIFDIVSNSWYTQTASGDIPQMRRRFCAGATWAEDQSSYNIYLYGGFGMPPNTTGFDDVYILTIPSFTWIKWYPTKPGPGRPHGDLSCNVIDRDQMLIIGGTFEQDQDCDAATVWGTHNLNLGENGPAKAMWESFWPNITKYSVPPEIIAQVEGGVTGGATVKNPAQSWNNRDLAVYFSRQATVSARTPTRAIPTSTAPASGNPTSNTNTSPSSSHTGAIAGGVVGGVLGLLLVLAIVLYCIRYLKKKTQQPVAASPTELPADRSSAAYTDPKTLDSYGTQVQNSGGTYSSAHTTSPLPSPHPASPVLVQHSSSPQQFYGQPAPQGPYFVLPTHDQQMAGFYSAQPQPQHFQSQSPPQSHPQNPPYDPTQDPSRQHNYPPPPDQSGHLAPHDGGHNHPASSPSNYSDEFPSTRSTPAQFYPQPLNVSGRQVSHEMPLVRSPQPASGKFIEEQD